MKLDLNKFFNNIREDNYFTIKTDTPYTPADFPNCYPVGKDIDIITDVSNFEKIKNKSNLFSKAYMGRVKIISSSTNYRLRFLQFKKLHYQIDISVGENIISEPFIKECFSEKILFNNYYILPVKYEIVFRYIYLNKKKKHHLKYIKKHIREENKMFYEKLGLLGAYLL